MPFRKSAAGYPQLRQTFERRSERPGAVQVVLCLDDGGQFADNLLHFLQALAVPLKPARFALTISCGDPQRNKNYRAAVFGTQKSDPIEARAMARFTPRQSIGNDPARTGSRAATSASCHTWKRGRRVNREARRVGVGPASGEHFPNPQADYERCYRLLNEDGCAEADVGDVCRIVGLSERHVAKIFDDGILSGYRTEKGHRRIHR